MRDPNIVSFMELFNHITHEFPSIIRKDSFGRTVGSIKNLQKVHNILGFLGHASSGQEEFGKMVHDDQNPELVELGKVHHILENVGR